MLRVANAVVAVVAVCLVMASCVLASIRSASAGANYKWFQPNLVRRNGHSHRHHHVRTHVDVLENASHPPETVIRAPSVIAPVIPTVSLSVPVHAVPAIPPAGVSTVYTPSVLTVMRRPVVTGFLHSPLPHHPPPLPPIPHSPVVPIVHHHHTSTGAPTPVPVYATFISHGPPNVKQRTVLLHHHHHHHRHVEAKSLTLNGLPVVVDPVAYNRKFQNSASEDEIIIKERDLAQLLHNKYTQFSDHSFEPARGQSYVRQDYHERKKAKFYYSGVWIQVQEQGSWRESLPKFAKITLTTT
ncbi:uncharacterized protein LOC111265582 isoform X2 [Varroa jacobsoni]|uniref:uncharacterized protein LOC111265582 isoform X2 n=1 Tax=Varroa jacobsoni TaxID=62625 RepID=UPI000BFA8689|nr:uncharacterized protein LOC111265582 isoform X2 [Varroa jacobsoni]